MTNDGLSTKHYETVRNEIMGRFFSPDEAQLLKEAIEARTVTSPEIRVAAAQCWPEEDEKEPGK